MRKSNRKALSISALVMALLIAGFQNCSQGGFKTLEFKQSELLQNSEASLSQSMEYSGDPVLQNQVLSLLMAKCASCNGTTEIGNIGDITDLENLIKKQMLSPGKASASPLVGSLAAGTLKQGVAAFSAPEVQLINNWINSLELVPIKNENPEVLEN
ncbi:MAG: hypothetical protein AABY64_14900 [Bdellovibrionota bacterium]